MPTSNHTDDTAYINFLGLKDGSKWEREDKGSATPEMVQQVLPGMLECLKNKAGLSVSQYHRQKKKDKTPSGVPSAWHTEEGIKHLMAIGVDVDCHKIKNIEKVRRYDCGNYGITTGKLTQEEAIDRLHDLVKYDGLPEPNMVIKQGYGLHVLWYLEHLTKPGHRENGWFARRVAWKSIANELVQRLKFIGAEPSSVDGPTMHVGLPGSKWKNRITRAEIKHDDRYTLLELAQSLGVRLSDNIYKEFSPEEREQYKRQKAEKQKTRAARKDKRKILSLQKIVRRVKRKIANSFKHVALLRVSDLKTLLFMRDNHIPQGLREKFLFVFRSHAQTAYGKDVALEMTLEMNRQLRSPLALHEAKHCTRSKPGGKIANKTLINWFSITEAEQRQLSSIRSNKIVNESRRAERAAKKNALKEKGIEPDKRKAKRMEQDERIRALVINSLGNITQMEIGAEIGCSQPTVARSLKRMNLTIKGTATRKPRRKKSESAQMTMLHQATEAAVKTA